MAAVTSNMVLSLYRRLLREGMKFSNYNYRNFAVRRVKDYIRSKKQLTDSKDVYAEYQYGLESLDLITRQVTIGRLYQQQKIVVESSK